ncbi:MAG: lysophospholipid acyltransferase family protein [Pyrinomonadaceae bacterium]
MSTPQVVRRRRSKHRRESSPDEPFVLPQRALEFMRPGMHFFFRLFWRIKYTGLENVPLTGGLIIAANHQTYIDPFWLGCAIKRPLRFLAWNEIFDWPVVGKLPGLFGAWPLEIQGGDPTAIRRSLEWLQSGGAIVIFPEGGRGLPDGSMAHFKTGAVRMALEAHVPILPVTIRGAHGVWPKHQRLPRPACIEIVYHPPITVEAQAGEDARVCARRESDRLAEIIRRAL